MDPGGPGTTWKSEEVYDFQSMLSARDDSLLKKLVGTKGSLVRNLRCLSQIMPAITAIILNGIT
ncbi:multiple C2 and transmembrane domain-containing protein 2-like [Pyrus ussuriensis x Pyrus communis]|uniref:Multiple C2 and transmembrane domain-containing protein 2-like n=1 Tax=Pyrus ussuriensis x Pyrus communis TaxID=2448454 RepID=A0A5N5HU63_9ROSA|nr:multiple C2 and transmembrane domain-containing protein 2-like [Pyrus ussuriensis x Pyrus communis]